MTEPDFMQGIRLIFYPSPVPNFAEHEVQERLKKVYRLLREYQSDSNKAAVKDFASEIKRKVKLEYESGGKYPGHIIDPYNDVVRPICDQLNEG